MKKLQGHSGPLIPILYMFLWFSSACDLLFFPLDFIHGEVYGVEWIICSPLDPQPLVFFLAMVFDSHKEEFRREVVLGLTGGCTNITFFPFHLGFFFPFSLGIPRFVFVYVSIMGGYLYILPILRAF